MSKGRTVKVFVVMVCWTSLWDGRILDIIFVMVC
jgi:hypothetical protein